MSIFSFFLKRDSLKHRIVFVVCMLSVVAPVILTALLFYVYYYLGIESLFTKQISTAVSNTVKIAQYYMIEHKNSLKTEAFLVANALSKGGSGGYIYFNKVINEQALQRGLSEILIFNKNTLVTKSDIGIPLFINRLPDHIIEEASRNEVVLIDDSQNRQVHAVVKLNPLTDTYLLISRYLDPQIVKYIKETEGTAILYHKLQRDVQKTKDKLEIAFVLISVSLLTLSIFIANKIANKIIMPLEKLTSSVLQTRLDNSSFINLKAIQSKYEITILAKAFNSMLQKVKRQHSEILNIKNLADARRVFIEKILSEIKTGVIVLDKKTNIYLINNAATSILYLANKSCIGVNITDIFCEINDVIINILAKAYKDFSQNIIIKRHGININLFVKLTTIMRSNIIENIVMTITDITELVAAQKSAAWVEIAKRIAHEIRNPLTPILLASEILKKNITDNKYDPNLFTKYIDAIIQNVENINEMVADFIDFAKLQTPVLGKYDLKKIIKDTVLIHKIANQNIVYNFIDRIDGECIIRCDKNHISRAITNLIKNSIEATEAIGCNGIISIKLSNKGDYISLQIEDNGGGIHTDMLSNVKEPYVSTKSGGVGIGLSIVQKILDDHNGSFEIRNTKHGTCAELYLLK